MKAQSSDLSLSEPFVSFVIFVVTKFKVKRWIATQESDEFE